MIRHPSEYWEHCNPDADTSSRADYTRMEANEEQDAA